MSLTKQIQALEKLTDLKKQLNAKTLDRKLTDINFFERTNKLFQPLIDSNVKQTEKITDNLKEVENNIKQQNTLLQLHNNNNNNILEPRTSGKDENIPQVSLEPRTSGKDETGGNSLFKQNENGEYYLAGEKNKTPRFEIKNNQIIFSKDKSNYIVDITTGLNELLFNKNFDKNKIKKEDVEQYYRIYGQLGVKEGNSNRAKNIHSLFQDINRKHYIKGGTGLNKTKNRLQVLLTSKALGQNNVDQEIGHLIKKQ